MFYKGDHNCQGKKKDGNNCNNKAYYKVEDLEHNFRLLCGVHSRSHKEERENLPENPEKKEITRINNLSHFDEASSAAGKNLQEGKNGNVICSKLRMMKAPEDIPGYLRIFPNFKHGNRKDGIGMPSLSPMSLGPVKHGQPGLPDAKNIENFHQGNKVFPSEVKKEGKEIIILQPFYDTRLDMYNDSIPHRHKESSGRNNIPLFSIWIDKNGNEKRMTYFESRQFYCTFYERLTKDNPDLLKLRNMIKDGYNIQICGYDAYPINDSIEKCYLDISKPFGHELVLYTLLTCPEENYPWRKYKTEDF